jgi:hypothetical protein
LLLLPDDPQDASKSGTSPRTTNETIVHGRWSDMVGGQLSQRTRAPLVALPMTVQVPEQPSRQLHDIGPAPQ